jgi:CheY-like chemotaxis protein
MQKKSLHLNAVINDLAKMLRRLIGEDVTLTLKHAVELPPVEGDVGMIEQVLMNLAVNARDAMPDGGNLLIETRRFTVDNAHLRRAPQGRTGDFARIEVRDNGCGMPPEVLARLFEPFFTTKPVGRGTGLGLATVYGIVKQHGGWIEVNSQVNTGTAFHVYLPITEASPIRQSACPAPTAHGQNQVILLVEDETSLRVLAQKLLEKAGYKVMAASSGAEALEKWRHKASHIDLILTDMVMPGGISGKQLADRIWAIDPTARVVFTSGYTNELSDETLAREKLQFLAKPYSPPEMLRVIAEALQRPRLARTS